MNSKETKWNNWDWQSIVPTLLGVNGKVVEVPHHTGSSLSPWRSPRGYQKVGWLLSGTVSLHNQHRLCKSIQRCNTMVTVVPPGCYRTDGWLASIYAASLHNQHRLVYLRITMIKNMSIRLHTYHHSCRHITLGPDMLLWFQTYHHAMSEFFFISSTLICVQVRTTLHK